MAVEGTVVEVKRGEPVPAHVGVGDVVVVQPDHGGPRFGMPHAEVTVSALSSEWPFPMCCSVWKSTSVSGARRWRGRPGSIERCCSCVLPDRCTLDQGLCCYACWCAVCAHAEVAEQNGIRGLCRQKEWYKQCGIIVGVYLLAGYFIMPLISCLFVPWIMTAYGTQVRDGVKRKWGLPDDECCGPTCTTYLPGYLGIATCVPVLFPHQGQCAAYQMLYFMKKRGAPAPVCPCYKHVCVHCSPPVDGAEEDKYQRISRNMGETLREADQHILEDLTDNLHKDVAEGDPFKNQNTKDETVTTTQPT